ncbi:MAG: 4-aminobutyrate aminotransferase/(S)-3-amino-2-methylpropionate transaminase [Natronomonas sp.]|jgi:4-aminobutyrate aminotransferase/(S)-3-amino-2-methylpropionate transaminase
MSEQTNPQQRSRDVEADYEEYTLPTWKDLDIPVKRAEGSTSGAPTETSIPTSAWGFR